MFHNDSVLRVDRIILSGLILLAGCTTMPEPDDSTTAFFPEEVRESQTLAPPPQDPPVRMQPPKSQPPRWIPLNQWAAEKQLGPLSGSPSNWNPVFWLDTTLGQFEIRTRSQVAKWDGAEFRLGFDVRFENFQPVIHELDLQKNFEPLLQPAPLPPAGTRIVVIDAGHGGGNGGTRSVVTGFNEKDYTLDWALRLEPLLRANQWQVYLTRTNDMDLPLSARVAFADQCRADLFVSLHFNAAPSGGKQAGLETFCLTPTGMRSTLTREYEDDPAAVFPNNRFDADNLRYAMLLHRALLKECGFVDRGVRRARFLGVLRGQNRPAVLLEAGYLSNPAEASRIHTPEFRQRLAEAVARALM